MENLRYSVISLSHGFLILSFDDFAEDFDKAFNFAQGLADLHHNRLVFICAKRFCENGRVIVSSSLVQGGYYE